MALASGYGFEADMYSIQRDDDQFLKPFRRPQFAFDETPGRYLISAPKEFYDSVNIGRDTPFPDQARIGSVGGTNAKLLFTDGEWFLDLPLSRLREAHEGWLPTYMSKVD